MDRGGQAGVVLDGIGAGKDVHRHRFLPRLAGVEHLEAGQLLVVLAQEAAARLRIRLARLRSVWRQT